MTGHKDRKPWRPLHRACSPVWFPEDQDQLCCRPAAAANASHSAYCAPVPLKGWPSTKRYKIQKGKRKQSEECKCENQTQKWQRYCNYQTRNFQQLGLLYQGLWWTQWKHTRTDRRARSRQVCEWNRCLQWAHPKARRDQGHNQ